MRRRSTTWFRRPVAWLALLLAASAFVQAPLRAEQVATRPLAPGITYHRIVRSAGPWVIHVTEADLSRADLRLGAFLAGTTDDLQRLSLLEGQITSASERPVATINGGFFDTALSLYRGRPIGLLIEKGELISLPEPPRSALVLRQSGRAEIAALRARAQVTFPDGVQARLSGLNQPLPKDGLVLYTPRNGASTRTPQEAGVEVILSPDSWPLRANTVHHCRVDLRRPDGDAPIPRDGFVLSGAGEGARLLSQLALGDRLAIQVELEGLGPSNSQQDEIVEAIGGGPRLLQQGRSVVEPGVEFFEPKFALQRHPRTAVGFGPGAEGGGQRLVLVVVDGRWPGYSEGMTLAELAELMKELGSEEAVNLDGGGSTEMLVRGEVMNLPSDGRERPIATALALFTSAPPGPVTRLSLSPPRASVLAGEAISLYLRAEDEYGNATLLPEGKPVWDCPPLLGSIGPDGRFLAVSWLLLSRQAEVKVSSGQLEASALLEVLPSPSGLQLLPLRLRLSPGGAARLRLLATGPNGEQLGFAPERVSWEVEGSAVITGDGTLQAGDAPGRVLVTARLLGASATSEILVGSWWRTLEGFEGEHTWRFLAWPPEVSGSVGRTQEAAALGHASLKLSYDFQQATGSRAAHALLQLPIGDASAIRLRVSGDASGLWLRARVTDAGGTRFALDLTPRVDWKDSWRQLSADIPAEAKAPLVWESVYLADFRGLGTSGALYLDDLEAEAY